MPVATVTVDFVNQPKEGKRYGSIKTKELAYLSVKPADLSQFTKGGVYEIEYAQKGEYKDFVKIISAPSARAGHNGGNGHQGNNAGRDIFVTGVVGRAMGSGKFSAADIPNLTQEAIGAWQQLAPKVDESPY